MKICLVGAELFHADWQTDRQVEREDEANISFQSFANAPKNLHTPNRNSPEHAQRFHT